MSSPPEPGRRGSLWVLWLILGVSLLPFVASYLMFHFAPPATRVNYGELLQTRLVPDMRLTGLDGEPVLFGSLRGKWLLLHIDSGSCDARCKAKLYALRQVRLTQGKNMDRVARIWLVDDRQPVDANLLREYEGTLVLRASPAALANFPATGARRDHIWLLDPLGNLVLRYPPAADPSGIKSDLQRLLRVSRIG